MKKPTRKKQSAKPVAAKTNKSQGQGRFHIDFKNVAQELAWAVFQKHDVLFLSGPAGTGKSFLSSAFAISEILNGHKKKIVLTRPIVEAGGESLGFLPGDFNEKVHPYMMPLFDCIKKLVGVDSAQAEYIASCIEVCPLCFMRGRTFDDSICILDEAQNCNATQLKLFLTRIGNNSKCIVNGDPTQSDIDPRHVALPDVMNKLSSVPGISILEFKADAIVRNPLIAAIIEKLGGGIN